ncbi:MAG: GspE/PulE family protein [Gammaproteobacteria bacterium]|nr:GspE/PulE family protein [Gammaproteobacteria bacterium]
MSSGMAEAVTVPEPERANRELTLEMVLGDLVADGLIDSEQATEMRVTNQHRRGPRIHPLVLVGNQNFTAKRPPHEPLTLDFLTHWLADRHGLEYHRIDPLKVDVAEVTAVVSYAYAHRRHILPIRVEPERVVFATAEPYVVDWLKELQPILRRDIERVISNPLDIGRYLDEFYNLSRSMKGASAEHDAAPSGITNLEQLVALGREGKLDANDRHVVSIVDWLLQYAFDQRASDIHIEPRREVGHIRFRIDGVLHNVYEMPTTVMVAVTSRLKAVARMDVVEKRRPQDGRLKSKTPSGSEIELRLSTMPTAFGEKMVLRIFDPEVLVRSFADLGFGKADRTRWRTMVGHVNGIVLVTGPTGSGKTTTLYSTLKQLARPEINVCSVEDPIEMVEDSFNQMQVQTGIGVTFASGIRTLLRQDPDVIMVGEIRDLETAEMAIQAALTGHLVLSTLHTNDAPSAITRLLELGVAPHMIRATLLGVLAQRLVRTLCPHCRQPGELEDQDWEALVAPWKVAKPENVHTADGCLECRRTGYRGRVGLYESLLVSRELRRHIVTGTDLAELRQACYREGMHPLRLAGARKVAAGLTTVEEVLNVAPGADD